MTLRVRELHPALGAEIFGIDAREKVSPQVGHELNGLFHRYQLLLFRGQELEPKDQIEFSRVFGDPAIHVLDQYLLDGHPEILVISNVIDDSGETEGLDEDGVTEWHSDFFWQAKPSIGSLLYGVAVPPIGGDTLFASMYEAWETLPLELQERIVGLVARRSLEYLTENERKQNPLKPSLTEGQRRLSPPVDHPLVRTHPRTHRRSLFLSQLAIEEIYGLTEEEKERLLAVLLAHATAEDKIYCHKWQSGDLVAWDNRCTIHTVTPSSRDHARVLHRTTLAGEAVY